jgi:hypothetical protein
VKAISTAIDTTQIRDERWRVRRLSVSLRGTLAATFMQMRRTDGVDAAHAFLCHLIDSDRPDLVRMLDGTLLVIGLASERGRFSPDW